MAPDDLPDLSPEELARVQTAIDAGTIWATVDGGRFAKRLIDAKKCKHAPGVFWMWLRDDDLYEPVYSKEVLNERVSKLLSELPGVIAAREATETELRFLVSHKKELIELRMDYLVTPAFMPWTRRRVRREYLEKLNALRSGAGVRPLTLDELPSD